MALPILPIIGSSGFYGFAAPFETAGLNQVEYVCKAIRRISDYLANNEDVKENIYTANGVSDEIFEEDVLADAYIVSLQSLSGHPLYVPARFILSYPCVNGIPYRGVMIGVGLPSLPVSKDLTFVVSEIADLVTNAVGVTPTIKIIETSKVTQVDGDAHALTQQRRAAVMSQTPTLTAKNHALQLENAELIQKIKLLEDYIIEKGI